MRAKMLSQLNRVIHSGHPVDELVVVAGSGRSGTSWLAEMINHDARYRYCFEPLDHFHREPMFSVLDDRRYICPHDHDPELRRPFEQLMAGQVFSWYTDQWDRGISLKRRDDLLIKLVDYNLLLGWLSEQFPQIRFVVVTRHPLAVLDSRRQLDWPALLDDLACQPGLVDDFSEPLHKLPQLVESELDRQVALWCIEQLVPLTQLSGERANFVRYEDLLVEPEKFLPDVLSHVGQCRPPEIERNARRPSKTAWNSDAFTNDPWAHATSWRSKFNCHEIASAERIVAAFGLEHLITFEA